MPSSRIHYAVARQWELLKQLPSHGRGTSSWQLMRGLNGLGFKVGKRQIERDLWELTDLFPIECDTESRPYLWRWRDAASIDLPGMSPAEALSLCIVHETVDPLLPRVLLRTLHQRFEKAQAHLEKAIAVGRANGSRKFLSAPPVPHAHIPDIPADIFEEVQEAVLDEVQIELEYLCSESQQIQRRYLHPLGLLQRGPVSFLVAAQDGKHGVHSYALHRIRQVRPLNLPCMYPEGFDLREYAQRTTVEFSGGTLVRLVLRVQPPMQRILAEAPLSADQRLMPNGGDYQLVATVSNTWQLQSWLLAQLDCVEVLSPADLRNTIADKVKNGSERYNGDG
ncbi:Predicted DNA-binding transcriptional regulator YafY, contains an HTH and WYL domains [Ectothiorhodosinus mongolicus]|uniref:Predicted DNA-binding transcriptional regulator YafY, contains an HTH and WYL domains n=1 Tax=Ectothiorhodosinus mongolicus TaxID=233100 RepID=A0A1R3W3H7_9GAMM|nr:WYL domain-containing protein [Ectothiorhodosinus mongolicus]ULX57467.1 WYL domain-containing protein [Ectothiorhodosinus mongolicus]SIT72340.1 Predicted DNA-binding transcriptional regulator YafY, contains an HTH and WYL domains [Ectothiorhodosinus mongolicus]